MVLYFTGTGNSQYVADVIARQLGDELVSINNYMKNGIAGDFISGKPYVLVCPTYAWRVPLVVEEWLKTARLDGCDDMYFVLTAGSGSGGAGKYARRLCDKIKMNYKGLATVKMPENYLAMFPVPSERLAKKIVAKALPVTEEIAKTIESGEDIVTKTGFVDGFMSTVINWIFFTFIVKDSGFHLEKECTSCGKCVEACPLNNIDLIEGEPYWQGNCTHCMVCICSCPAECIEYKKATQKRRRYWFGR